VGVLEYSHQAREDLRKIHSYIAEDSVGKASSVVGRILAAIDILEKSPRAGRARSEYGPDVRTLTAHPFVVFYRLSKGGAVVHVLRVIDGRRDLGTVFFSPLIAA
jgi:plasmid stabilization system protein ParE